MMSNVILKELSLPEFSMEGTMPDIPLTEYESRINQTCAAMQQKGLDFLLVFADREHFANFCYLTGLDPRFEEALLIMDKHGKCKILLGNECMNWGTSTPLKFEYELFQDFSLLGQDRSRSRSLTEILKDFGISSKSKVGGIYYKYFTNANHQIIPEKSDLPAYLYEAVRTLCEGKAPVNAADMMMDASYGSRNRNCLEMLVRFEWASVRVSESMKRMIFAIRPGAKEYELASHYHSEGLPYSCHPMLSSGKKVKYGLSSPSSNTVKKGDAFTAAFGLWGALSCRAGMVASGPDDLPADIAASYEQFWRNYFKVIATWYETVGIGVSGDEVMQSVERVRDTSLFDFALNAGHTIHLDEWVNSPFYFGSQHRLYSGMALQMDIIPTNTHAFVAANAEDGIVLADESLRTRWKNEFPESWKRIELRKKWMQEKLGINLKPEVLPLSNIPACFSPYLLEPGRLASIS